MPRNTFAITPLIVLCVCSPPQNDATVDNIILYLIIVSVLPRQRHIPSEGSHKSVGSALLAEDFDVGLSPEGTLKSVLWDCVLPLLAACLPCSCTRLVASVTLCFSGGISLQYSVCSSVKITSLLVKRPFDLRFLMISLDIWMSVKRKIKVL